jgi:CBS domain-containing protein
MPQRRVQDFVRGGHHRIVSSSASLRDVALQMMTSDCDLLAVSHADGRLAGVITESSVVRALLANPHATQTIESCVTAYVDSVRRAAPLSTVLHLFRSSCHTAVPVVDEDERVCGLLLRRDVMAVMLNPAAALSDDGGRKVRPPADPGGSAPIRHSAELPTTEALTRRDRVDQPSGPAEPVAELDRSAQNASAAGENGGSASPAADHGPPHASEDTTPNDGRQQRPHFIRGDEARRRLGSASDFRGGTNELPW